MSSNHQNGLTSGAHAVNSTWKVEASCGALNTSNPIREIIETMDLSKNPDKKTIPLSIGDPTIFGNLKPCKEILDALQRANECGKFYGYQMAAGMESAREAVADYHFRSTGDKVMKQDVILASGCSHAIDLCICVLAKHGQNILIPRPGFPLYKTLTSVYGVQYKQYNLLAEQNWSIDLEHLESLIDENTAAIVINNPSNPCGSVYSTHHLLQILELAERYKKPIIADEIYDKFVFSPKFYQHQHDRPEKKQSSNTTMNVAGDNVAELINTKQERDCGKGLTNSKLFSNHQEKDYNDDSGNLNDEEDDYVDLSDSVVVQDEDRDEELELELDEDEDTSMGIINDHFDCNNHDSFKVQTKTIYFNHHHHQKTNQQQDHTIKHQEMTDVETETMCLLDSNQMHYVPFTALSSLSKTVPILTCGGISKTCLIPGLRLGWIIINDRQNIFDVSIRIGLSRLTQRLMGPNSLVQGALEDILKSVPDSFYTSTMDFIFNNAKLCYERLRLIRGLKPHMPQGSMYLMVRFQPDSFPDIAGDLDFTSKLMNEESVLVLPGKCFDFPNYFRICLTVPTGIMEEALDRMRDFCGRHYVNTTNILTAPNKLQQQKSLSNNGNSFALVTTTTTTTTTNATNNFTVTRQQEKKDLPPSTKPLLKLAHLSSQQANRCK